MYILNAAKDHLTAEAKKKKKPLTRFFLLLIPLEEVENKVTTYGISKVFFFSFQLSFFVLFYETTPIVYDYIPIFIQATHCVI
jgi:hypothetical protein